MSKGGNPRRPRVSQAIRSELTRLIPLEMSDPRIRRAGPISINHVDLNSDMGIAVIYVAFCTVDDDEARTAVDALAKAAGVLRGPLARSLNLKRAPQLRFVFDNSTEFAMKVSALVRDEEGQAASEGIVDAPNVSPEDPEPEGQL